MFSKNSSGLHSIESVSEKKNVSTKYSMLNLQNKKTWLFWTIIFVGLVLTLLSAVQVKKTIDAESKTEFDFVGNEIKNKIVTRLQAHAQLLRSGSAFIENSNNVTREEWHKFVEHQEIENNLPGIQGTGYTIIIPSNELASHEQKIRSQGFPHYAVKPAGKRDIYTSIIYLEPFKDRNLRAFGYDMFSEPIRRIAMEYARDYNAASLSGKITLVQETDEDIQAGTLMYVPVYQSNLPVETIEERRNAIIGWVYSPYRMNDLMNGILGGYGLNIKKQFQIEIYDDSSFSSEALLFDSRLDKNKKAISSSIYNYQTQIVFNNHYWNHKWFIRFTKGDNPYSEIDYSKVWIVAIGGVAVSVLLSVLFLTLINTGNKAQALADVLTKNLRESEERFRNLFVRHEAVMLIIEPLTGLILDANASAEKFYGYSKSILLKMSIDEINELSKDQVAEERKKALAEKKNYFIFPHKLSSGKVRQVEVHSSPILFQDKLVLFSIIHDITDRKHAEEALHESESRWQFALEGAGDGVWDWDAQTNKTYFSLRYKAMLGYGQDEIGGTLADWEKLVHPDDLEGVFIELNKHLAGQTEIYTYEHRLRCKDGSYKWILDRGKVISRSSDGKPLRVIGTHTDISERKQDEDKIKRQLHEKEVLLREVHHRIKNNITSIGNLLSIHANTISNPEAHSILQDAIGRVQSMGLIYNKLLLTNDYKDVSVKKYLDDLIDAVVNIFSQSTSIVIDKKIDDFELDVKRIFPLGTIVNELLTNVFKYAFVNRNSGSVKIGLIKNKDHILLTIQDNGNGLPKGFDVSESNGLGLMLVKMLCQQLDATFKIESEQGTCSSIEFDV